VEYRNQEWIEKAKETFKFHRSKLISNEKWTATATAKALKRSVGSVSEDLMIARWLRTHEKQIERCETAYQALEFIRKAKKSMDMLGEV
jgi:transcriptional regulator